MEKHMKEGITCLKTKTKKTIVCHVLLSELTDA